MLLTLDRGNTTLDAMLHAAAPRRERRAPDAALGSFLGADRPRRCVGVSVVPGGLDRIEAELRDLGIATQIVGRDLRCPLPLDYETPATLGADRWLGALAAWRTFGRSVVVDCGSATTVNLVDVDGTFRGGAIAPGWPALAVGMAQITPHLPLSAAVARGNEGAPFEVPPRSSTTAVQAGLELAFCGAIERLVADALRAARGPATVVLTGGNADRYLRHARLQPRCEPDLVHRGLALLAGEVEPPCAT